MNPDRNTPAVNRRRLAWAAATIGFALSGFFDGILLHQVLQWHHLFSLVSGEQWADIRNQILMDGWFHVLHYAIAAAGLWLLWRARGGFSAPGADRRLLGAALLGFSAWQFVDVVLFHWALMIHRIRVGVPNPLAYDLGWLFAFGVTTLAAGLWLWRGGGNGQGRGAAAGLAALVLLAGPVAALPAPASATLVLFPARTDPAQALAAAAVPGARILWASPDGGMVAVAAQPSGQWRQAMQLYARGALLVSSTPVLGGCLGWLRA